MDKGGLYHSLSVSLFLPASITRNRELDKPYKLVSAATYIVQL